MNVKSMTKYNLIAIAVAFCAPGAQAQFDPNTFLQKLQKSLSQPAPDNKPAPAASGTPGTTPKFTTAPTSNAGSKSPAQESSQSNTTTTSGNDYCQLVRANPTIARYVDQVTKVVKLKGNRDLLDDAFKIDVENMLFQWVAKKFVYTLPGGYPDWTRIEAQNRRILPIINQCAYSLFETDYFYFFVPQVDTHNYMRDKFEKLSKASAGVTTRALNESGVMVESKTSFEINWNDPENWILKGISQNAIKDGKDSSSSPIAAYAMLFEGGEKALETVAQAYFARIEPRVSDAIKGHAARKENDEQEVRKYQKIVAAKVAQDAEIRNEIRKGNLKAARSCSDLAILSTQNGFQASVSPTNKLISGIGTLEKFQESKLLGIVSGEGYIKSQLGQYAMIKANKDTQWFDKNGIKIGSHVIIVGKYVANVNISLTSGASVQSPVLELVCIGQE